MAKKYYAVACGRTPGIYQSWKDCFEQTHGFSGAVFRGFDTLAEAEAFLSDHADAAQAVDQPAGHTAGKSGDAEEIAEPYAFVDGSFNSATGVYGCGGFLVSGGVSYPITGSGDDPEMASMRNVAGEILGASLAVKKAQELGLSELTICYDYYGIERWATGAWKTNKEGTRAYRKFMLDAAAGLSVHFHKVKAHSGLAGNEAADQMARKAVGIAADERSKN